MTEDFAADLMEACEREGVHYCLVMTGDKGENFKVYHNIYKMEQKVNYPDGCIRTRQEDMEQLMSSIDFSVDLKTQEQQAEEGDEDE